MLWENRKSRAWERGSRYLGTGCSFAFPSIFYCDKFEYTEKLKEWYSEQPHALNLGSIIVNTFLCFLCHVFPFIHLSIHPLFGALNGENT